MTIRKIYTYPDPVLKEKARPVEVIDDNLRELAADMIETMYSASGVGLAAPQVGESIRMIVFDASAGTRCDDDEQPEPQPTALFNPEITQASGETSITEGCLSLPEFTYEVDRADKIRLIAIDIDGRPIEMIAEGFTAIVLQHEIDHLDGKLLVDYASSLKRTLYRKRRKKEISEEGAD